MKTEILYGIHPVAEALAAGRRKIHEIYIAQESDIRRMEGVYKKIESRHIPVQKLPRQQIQALSGKDAHQGIAAKVSPYPTMTLTELTGIAEKQQAPPLYLLIDHVVDLHNLGALIRTALCANFDGVVIPKDRTAPPSPVVSKTSAGALEHIRLAQVVNMVQAISELKKKGVWIIGLDMDGNRSLFETDLTGGIGMVVGGEESGIRPLVKKNCDFLCFIPQAGPVGSLNASVAGGVAMYEAYRQRNR